VAPLVRLKVCPVDERPWAVTAAEGSLTAVGGQMSIKVLTGGTSLRAKHAAKLFHSHMKSILVLLQINAQFKLS
jgi:ferric-dicitrate binding protein FerR (iron transport regulator)